MREHPILLSGPMVRATLNDEKTNTRRVVKPQPASSAIFADYKTDLGYPASFNHFWAGFYLNGKDSDSPGYFKCPYGIPGDRLWVRETMYVKSREDVLWYRSDNSYRGAENEAERKWIWKRRVNSNIPSIHMPHWASRITLEITAVRVERLQEITGEDARAEGCLEIIDPKMSDVTIVQNFRRLWDSLNGKKYPWSSNPWVWVITFKKEAL